MSMNFEKGKWYQKYQDQSRENILRVTAEYFNCSLEMAHVTGTAPPAKNTRSNPSSLPNRVILMLVAGWGNV